MKKLLRITSTYATHHEGPIPPASALAEYEELIPGSAQQIIDWADGQINHRQRLEKLVTEGSEQRNNRGQYMAFAISALCLVLIPFVGNPWVQGVLAIVAVGGPTAAIYLARTAGRNNHTDE